MNNYYKSGRHNNALTKAYFYDKRKKEIKDVKKDKDNPTK